MTELELYKKAYSLLVGRVDRVVSHLESVGKGAEQASANLDMAVGALTAALQAAEDVFLDEDPEDT